MAKEEKTGGMNSFLKWFGGKSKMAKTIVELMPEHACYCEVFSGAAWVLFRKEPAKNEIINDKNQELVNLFRVIKHHKDEFLRQFQYTPISRFEFDLMKKTDMRMYTDIQRASVYYYLIKLTYGGQVKHFNISMHSAGSSVKKINPDTLENTIERACGRLRHVQIENMDYQELIPRYDKPGTFFYLDPPYWGYEDAYGKNLFSREDFIRMRDLLKGIQGKFIMSINNVPEIREIYKDFNIREVDAKYSIKINSDAKELLIMNY